MVACRDCGAVYEHLGLDMVLPDKQWNLLCPEGGILCANCICKRAARFGGTAMLTWVENFDYGLPEGLECSPSS